MISLLEKNRWFSLTITIWIALTIFYISSLEIVPSAGPQISIFPIVYHITAFFFLALFLLVSVLDRRWSPKNILLSLALVTFYAILDEFHQHFVPSRVASLSDFFLDFSGITIAFLIYFILIFMKE